MQNVREENDLKLGGYLWGLNEILFEDENGLQFDILGKNREKHIEDPI